jgi:hypothetical protein
MVRMCEKYKYSERESHFRRLDMLRSIAQTFILGAEAIKKYHAQTLVSPFYNLLSAGPHWPEDLQTRCEKESGTTSPEFNKVKI